MHSRVARSNIQGFQMMGMQVTVIGPPTLIPRGIESLGVRVEHDLSTLASHDVIYVLRLQRERMAEGANFVPTLREYAAVWGIGKNRLRRGQKVMHPGPINRGVELTAQVADDPDTLILQQVESGLATRMAILYRTIVGYSDAAGEETS